MKLLMDYWKSFTLTIMKGCSLMMWSCFFLIVYIQALALLKK